MTDQTDTNSEEMSIFTAMLMARARQYMQDRSSVTLEWYVGSNPQLHRRCSGHITKLDPKSLTMEWHVRKGGIGAVIPLRRVIMLHHIVDVVGDYEP